MTLALQPLSKTPLQRAKDAYNARNGDHELKLRAAMMADDQFGPNGEGWSFDVQNVLN